MSEVVDREQLRVDLSDALQAVQGDCDVTGFGRAREPCSDLLRCSALVWSLVQVIAIMRTVAPTPSSPPGGVALPVGGNPFRKLLKELVGGGRIELPTPAL